MTARHATELLYDSEAALRLVDSAIEDIRQADPRRIGDPARAGRLRELLAASGPLGLTELSQVLTRGYGEIISVLGSLRESRNVLERTTGDRLQRTHQMLREASIGTELAATDVLDGLDRAIALVNEMDARANASNAGADLRARLRAELFGLVGGMQVQDITRQRLTYASSVLVEMETRLAELATLLDPASLEGPTSAAVNPATAAP